MEDKVNRSRAFEKYYNDHYARVFHYVLKKVANVQEAEDIVMNAFASCWSRFEAFDPKKASFQTWLYVVVNNKLKNYYRDKKPHIELEDSLATESTPQDELLEAAELDYLRDCLAKAMEHLSETQKKIIILKYFKGKTSPEIAEKLGISPGNVRIQLKRTLDKLREYLKNIRWE